MITNALFIAAIVAAGPGGIFFQQWAERQPWCPEWLKSSKYKSTKGKNL